MVSTPPASSAGQRNGVDGAIDDDHWDHRAPLHQIDCRIG